MKLMLDQQEIEEIILDHVRKTVSLVEGKSLQLELSNTRGPAGTIATIEFSNVADTKGPESVSIVPENVPVAAKAVSEKKPAKLAGVTTDPVDEEAEVAEAATTEVGDTRSLFGASKDN